MRRFQGIPVAPGVAIAPAFWRTGAEGLPLPRSIRKREIDAEIERFQAALETARAELGAFAGRSGLSDAVGSIAAGHREFLKDPTLLGEIEGAIRNGRCDAEYAVAVVFRRWIGRFRALDDEFFRQRYVDLVDLERRVLRHLRRELDVRQPTPDRPAILVARDLTPSETAELDRKSVVGFATEQGGATSHTAIVAKSLGIPAVCGLGSLVDQVAPDTILIVDGESGQLVVDPDPRTLDEYRDRKTRLERRFRVLKRMAELPAETPDGWPVGVQANIEFPFEVDEAVRNGADGIGLYRTEFLYADAHALPDEVAHLAAYREALERLKGRPLTIRTFDFGADKFAEEIGMHREPNPYLGCRSLRYSFARPELFRTQLRAILRAAAEGQIRLMFPMVSSVSEFRRARRILEQVQEELRRERVPYGTGVRIGAMIEIPSAAITADLLAQEAEFFSIGSNDLTQYTLAVDRGNERVASLFRPSNPSILRLLRNVLQEGDRATIPVGVCGEMAAERPYTLLLLGVGIRHFSVAPSVVPEVKRTVRSVTRQLAREVADKALALPTPEEVDAYLGDEAERLLGDTF